MPWSTTGALLAVVAAVEAVRPSLLPRSSLVQGAVCGVAALTAYAVGATAGAVARALARRPRSDRVRPWAMAVLAVTVVVGGWLVAGRAGWQAEQARELGVGEPWSWPVVVAVAAAVFAVGLLLARGLRSLAHRLPGGPVAGGVLVTLGCVALVVASYALLQAVFARIDASTAGQSPPTSAARSGGPGSAVPWDTLGAEGRTFVTGGPTAQQLAAFAGTPSAPEPVRVFVGLQSAPDAAARAALAVDELRRTRAFERSAVAVVTSTGNGFVDPVAVSSLEYVLGGDVATVAQQYSVLPSWLSFLVDQGASEEAGRALFEAVRAAVEALPAASRPRLLVYGESLGAFGSQAAFAGLSPEQVVDRVDGALWVGPPAASGLWSDWSARAQGGTAWQPVLDGGRTVRWAADMGAVGTAAVATAAAEWGPKRILFLQNPTDPVVWWSPALFVRRPAWLDDPRGPGVSSQVRWWPLLLGEQVGLDLPPAVGEPPGVGHDYTRQVPAGWVAVLQPPGWTAADTDRLTAAVAG